MFDQIPNASVIGRAVSVGCRQTASAWNLQPQAGIHGSNWGSIKLKEIFSSGDLEIPFVLIGPEVKGLKPD